MTEKICADCAEYKKGKCHEMFDKPINEIDECPFGIDEEEVNEIAEQTKGIKIDHGLKGNKPREKEKSDDTEKKVVKKKPSDKKKDVYALVWSILSDEYGEEAKKANENKLILIKNGEKTIKIDFSDSKTVKFE